MRLALTFALDVGWSADFTTLVGNQSLWRKEQPPPEFGPEKVDVLYHFMWMVERYPHSWGPKKIVELVPGRIAAVKAQARKAAIAAGRDVDDEVFAYLAVDASNDRSFIDHFPAAKILGAIVRPIIITAGNTETIKPDRREAGVFKGAEANVSRTRLITNLKTTSGFQRLQTAPGAELKAEAELRTELGNLQQHVTAAANLVYRTEAGQHDDLVMALAMAVWLAERVTPKADPPPPGMATEDIKVGELMQEW